MTHISGVSVWLHVFISSCFFPAALVARTLSSLEPRLRQHLRVTGAHGPEWTEEEPGPSVERALAPRLPGQEVETEVWPPAQPPTRPCHGCADRGPQAPSLTHREVGPSRNCSCNSWAAAPRGEGSGGVRGALPAAWGPQPHSLARGSAAGPGVAPAAEDKPGAFSLGGLHTPQPRLCPQAPSPQPVGNALKPLLWLWPREQTHSGCLLCLRVQVAPGGRQGQLPPQQVAWAASEAGRGRQARRPGRPGTVTRTLFMSEPHAASPGAGTPAL